MPLAERAPDRAETVARLRAHLARVAPVRGAGIRGLPSGFEVLDARTGGWPRPGLALVQGAPGVGRLGLLLPAMQAVQAEGRGLAVVDPVGWFNPPGMPGVDMGRLLLVRAGGAQAAWATEQLARSGALPLVILLDPPPLRRAGRRLQHAAEAGHCSVVILSELAETELPAALRLEVQGPGRVLLHKGPRGPGGLLLLDDAGGPLSLGPDPAQHQRVRRD